MTTNLFDASLLTVAVLSYAESCVGVILLFILGYVLGSGACRMVRRALHRVELEKTLLRYGAIMSELWTPITEFVSQYIKWFIVVSVLSTLEITVLTDLWIFMSSLLWFIVLLVAGLLVGGIAFKIVKEGLVTLGLETGLQKHGLTDAFGGLMVSNILADIVKWYLVLLFLDEGVCKLGLTRLSLFIDDLITYVPNAVLGTLVLLAALLIARFVRVQLTARKLEFSEVLALCAESTIIFFGIVVALPKFGVEDVSVLEDSFKILFAGVSLGLSVAAGLGLKNHLKKMFT